MNQVVRSLYEYCNFYDALCVSGDINMIKELKLIYLKYLQILKVSIQTLQK